MDGYTKLFSIQAELLKQVVQCAFIRGVVW